MELLLFESAVTQFVIMSYAVDSSYESKQSYRICHLQCSLAMSLKELYLDVVGRFLQNFFERHLRVINIALMI